MATFIVTTTSDSGAGSLRQAVLEANAAGGVDEIRFDASVFDGEAGDRIRLTSGEIEITDGLTIVGGPAGVTITGDANGDDVTLAGGITDVAASGAARLDDNSRIFDATAALTLGGLTLTGGRTTADDEGGGAVRGTGVTLTSSTISGNSTAGERSYGGGVLGSVVTLTNSTVMGNSTAGDFSRGGGVFGFDVTLTNSTVSGNSTAGAVSEGGGVAGYGMTLTNSIVLGNASVFAGVAGDEVWGNLTLTDGNILGGDLFNGGANVGDVAAADVFAGTTEITPGMLAGVLADNGGPTRTILIGADGPAVDAGGATALPIDQRGLERVFASAVDLGAVEVGAGPAEPGSMVVTTALDVVANDGLTSLREAVFFANSELGADTITFDASVFDGEANDRIRLTSGQIEITDGLMITGGPAGVTITGDANGDDVTLAGGITDVAASGARRADNSRIFDATAALTLEGLTLTGGRTTEDSEQGGAVRGTTVTLIDSTVSGNSTGGEGSFGGGVFGGNVTLRNSTVSGNGAGGEDSGGGGVWGDDVTLTNSTVSDNSTEGNNSGGGGVRGGVVTLTNSTISGNSTAGLESRGGGVFSFNSVTLTNSTVSGNSTTSNGAGGGGISGGVVTLTNSTVSGNSIAGKYGSRGGGVLGGVVTLTNSTISGNSTAGEAISGGGGVAGRDVRLTNSIVLGNATIFAGVDGDEVEGAVTRTGGNIIGGDLFDDDADVGDVTAAEVFAATVEIAPAVFAGVLADHGGPTRTIAIRADGPARGGADPASATATDQRGFARDAAPDLGAFEAAASGEGLTLVGGPQRDVLTGSAFDDQISGRGGNDVLRGLGGADRLFGGGGRDALYGGDGRDYLAGGGHRDKLWGGDGADVFRFGAASDVGRGANRDQILDFSRDEGDKIDLSAIDADTTRRGDQDFDFIGTRGFSGDAGELRYRDGRLYANTDGDRTAEFEIALENAPRLGSEDFFL